MVPLMVKLLSALSADSSSGRSGVFNADLDSLRALLLIFLPALGELRLRLPHSGLVPELAPATVIDVAVLLLLTAFGRKERR